ncbi:major facilitator superfamily domain-containing protein [Lasiosphaeria miniovina]|uniref:Major facilitator superfamily domain-containing protein n=1 Tax=Lasiosphaeria miniovina TaxID=1954250 RepID=A0AA40B5N9_9PEZI|nr:major facilitator superfamily domain-containing protein [Lasiosphaeria miniovina]KAK0727823.1 major facilitator superfamily domain-containing protein [Lasiosphaeria miniovina]
MPGWNYAFSLSREAVKAATPPGTVRLIGKNENRPQQHSITQHNGRYVDRVANFPVPTADPADPLNWARWRKFSCLAAVSSYAFVANFVSASLAPALPIWNLSFPQSPRPPEDLVQFIAFNVLLLGLGNIFWVPLANVFGRRPIMVFSTLTLFIATACGTMTSDFGRVLAIRVFQGLGSSASETVTPAIVGDMFFVHERGGWMALYTASLASGSVVGGICGGYIAARLGWFALFEVNAVLSGLTLLCAILLVPETIYHRASLCLPVQRNIPRTSRFQPRTPAPYLSLVSLPSMHMTVPSRFVGSIDQGPSLTWYQTSSSSDLSSPTPFRVSKVSKQNRSSRATTANAIASERQTPFTFLRSLKFGMYRGNVLYQFKKPWFTLRLPATWIVMFQYGGLVGGVAVISSVGPLLLDLPPYQWGDNSGLLFIGALVGIVLGGLYTSLLADKRLKQFAKNQDHGFAEPESRIPVLLPSLAVATGGLLVFGFCAQNPGRYQWVGLEFAYGMVSFALTQVPSIWFSYLIDSYAQLASDCFVMICILRGIIPFAWTFFVSQWVQRDGYLIPFGGFTVIMGVFSLLILPVIWMGKRMRIATARYVVGNQ